MATEIIATQVAAPAIGRRCVLAGVSVVAILEFTLGPQHPLTSFSLNTLAGGLGSSLVQPDKHAVNNGLAWKYTLSLLHGLLVAGAARLLSLDHALAALIPALLQIVLACLVARTLLPDRVPAIRRIAAALNPPGTVLPPDIDQYTRAVTWAWVFIFVALATANITWLWVAGAAPVLSGVMDAAVIAAMIVAEFLYRKHRYANHEFSNFAEFWKSLRQLDPRRILLT